jgi:hypothetical protein
MSDWVKNLIRGQKLINKNNKIHIYSGIYLIFLLMTQILPPILSDYLEINIIILVFIFDFLAIMSMAVAFVILQENRL